MSKSPLPAAPALALLATIGLPAAAVAAADLGTTLQARDWAAACANCHGYGGRPPADSPIPALAGRPAAQLVAQMADFKSDRRDGTVMPQIAKGYSEAQVAAIAAWFAASRGQGD